MPAGPPGDGTSRSRLAQLEGFLVISPDGPLGRVTLVEADADGRPSRLAVRSGLFVERTDAVPAASLLAVVPRRRRVLVDWRRPCD